MKRKCFRVYEPLSDKKRTMGIAGSEIGATGKKVRPDGGDGGALTQTTENLILRAGLLHIGSKFSDDANKGPATATTLCLREVNFADHEMPSGADWLEFQSLKEVDFRGATGKVCGHDRHAHG